MSTTGEGHFTVPELKADLYSLKVEAAGFKTATLEDIQVAVQVTRPADVRLEVGSVGETVTVSAVTARVLQTETPGAATQR